MSDGTDLNVTGILMSQLPILTHEPCCRCHVYLKFYMKKALLVEDQLASTMDLHDVFQKLHQELHHSSVTLLLLGFSNVL